MSELSILATIADRSQVPKFLKFYASHQLAHILVTVARGTATSETLDYFGLDTNERALLLSVVVDEVWRTVKQELQRTLQIDAPGNGIAFTIPLSSIGGMRQLQFLTEGQPYVHEEERTLKDTKYELLMVIANQGYTELVMDAARQANAGGGTIIHAKGTGMERAEQFLGVSLASEKEIVWIVVRKAQKNAIMQAIMEKAGLESKAKSILFSLPVTSIAGMRLLEDEEA